ncbi:MAG: UDP-N-acetylglucosamine 2-epimerase (non-hydrolyzing) [Candidatus Omnitrophica bacterium]|nr:UDP-N-acetylglucosamine 2-epimerase (non-hydrolyzing) [Candidatus Omnitrophota bacterium]
MKRIKILSVVGARPNMMKIAPFVKELSKHRCFKSLVVHTGQHYDTRMSKVFFEDLELSKPGIYLGVGSGSHAVQTACLMERLEKVFLDEKPHLIVVVGDVNSTMAAALTAAKLVIPIAHIESGLRSFDRAMPEEINRIVTDSISEYLFAPSKDAVENLKNEGIPRNKIFLVGNIMIDTLSCFRKKADKSRILKKLKLSPKGYALFTLHRPSNVDSKKNLSNILDAVKKIQEKITVVFPVHLRTEKMIKKFGLEAYLRSMKQVIVTQPYGYLDFMKLLTNSRFVLTDSGGIQEETTVLKIPCITLRDRTERPLTLKEGTNVLVGNNTKKIILAAFSALTDDHRRTRIPALWDGKTAKRIVRVLLKKARF